MGVAYFNGIILHLRTWLPSAAQLLVPQSAITPAELMDLFIQLRELYDIYDCRVLVASLVEVYKDDITAHFTRLRKIALKTDSELLPHVSVITPELRMALDQLAESTRQSVTQYIIPDRERGRAGSHYKADQVIDMLDKQNNLGKAINAIGDKSPDDKSSSKEKGQHRCKKANPSSSSAGSTRTPSSSGGSSNAQCFLCCVRGHRISECRVLRDRWVSLETLPSKLHN